MSEPRNRVVQVRRFGNPDVIEVVDAPLPIRIKSTLPAYDDKLIVLRGPTTFP
jgi:hypothetical protein